jgi:aminopeptidase
VQRTFDENLALYAQLIVRKGLAIRQGQELLVFSDIADPRLARLVAAEAYKAGAKNVELMWSDPEVTLIRYREGSDEAMSYVPQWLYDGITRAHRDGAARLGLFGSDPGLLSGIPPDRVATNSRAQSAAKKEMSELITAMHFPWCLVGAASPGWAAKVFPGESEEVAVSKLWDAIFLTSRIFEPDPIAAWSAHCDALDSRMHWLNELKLDSLHFRGGGTDLRVGLVDGHIWEGGWSKAKDGTVCAPNIPTEEVFTMPHRARIDGVVRSSKPLSERGQVVDGIEMEFKDGVAVRANAALGAETLERLLASDEGAKRLGEVALVPNSSKVAQAGILFYNSLYDENAASHIAMGACYAGNMSGYEDLSEEERLGRGANDSIIHVDWMIGSAGMDVDGMRADGSAIPLMRSGEWS